MTRILYDCLSGNQYGFDDQVVTEISYTKEEIQSLISAVLKIRGLKESLAELPLEGNTRGDVWIVRSLGLEYVWLEDASSGTIDDWEQLGPMHDLSGYYTKSEIDAMLGVIPAGETVMGLLNKRKAELEAYIASNNAALAETNAKLSDLSDSTKQFIETIGDLGMKLTTDTTVVSGKTYYKRNPSNGLFVVVSLTPGETVPEGTYEAFTAKSISQRILDLENVKHTHHEVTSFDELPLEGNTILDTATVKTLITGETFEMTGYVWGGESWMPLDSKYDARSVIFHANIPLAGSYTSVGNVKITDNELQAKGKSVYDMFSKIFDQVVQPTLGAAPTGKIQVPNAGEYEVGTNITVAYFSSFTPGKYNHPWDGTTVEDGTTANEWTIKFNNVTRTSIAGSGSFGNFKVGEGVNTSVTGSVTYNEGSIALDNKGNESDPIVQRPAGSITLTSSAAIKAFRYIYIGSVAEDVEVTEDVIKSLSKFKCAAMTKKLAATGGDVKLVDGAVKVIVAIPTGTSKTSCGGYGLSEVLLVSASNTPITSDYKAKDNVQVSGAAAGQDMKDYKVYVYQPASIDAGEVHSIKIA